MEEVGAIQETTSIIMVIVTTLLVLITAYYAFVTQKISKDNQQLVKLNRELIQSEFRPYVQVSFPNIDTVLKIKIANYGRRSAHDIELSIESDPELKSLAMKPTLLVSTGQEKINFLEPGGEIVDVVNYVEEIIKSTMTIPEKVTITACYRDSTGFQYFDDPYSININSYLYENHIRGFTMNNLVGKISKEIKELAKKIN